jgi:hypothetical protein
VHDKYASKQRNFISPLVLKPGAKHENQLGRYMDLHQARFLDDEFFGLTFMATVQRAKVYADDTGDKEKSAFPRALRSQLDVLAKLYREGVSEETHVQSIVGLSDSISISHAHISRSSNHLRATGSGQVIALYIFGCAIVSIAATAYLPSSRGRDFERDHL